MKTLLHIDDSEKWGIALGNARNLVKYAEQTGLVFELEIIANGKAVEELAEDKSRQDGLYAEIEDLALETVKFAACRNALNRYEIKESSLIPFVEVVPAGIAEITKKQHDGFAYMKA